MFEAIERVRQRQSQIVESLARSRVAYALSGSNATFEWVASVEEAAVRQYRNVEFIIRRESLPNATHGLSKIGLIAEERENDVLFRLYPEQRERWTDRALFAGQMMSGSGSHIPDLGNVSLVNNTCLLPLHTLVEFQLSRWELDDKVDLRDLLDVGLLDDSWLLRLPSPLAERLQELLDDPDG